MSLGLRTLIAVSLAILSWGSYAKAINSCESSLCCEGPPRAERGVVLLYHGLNHNPETFSQLREVLHQEGFETCLGVLRGHIPNQDRHDLSHKVWIEDIGRTLHQLMLHSENRPRYLLGYSIGAVALVAALDQDPSVNVDGFLLLAPPFELRWKASVVRILTPLRAFRVSLPSLNPEKYRLFPSTSLQAYHASLKIIDATKVLGNPERIGGINGVIVVSRNDELISWDGIGRWLSRNKISAWQVHSIEPKSGYALEHLIVDEESLGEEAWERLRNIMLRHFNEDVRHRTTR